MDILPPGIQEGDRVEVNFVRGCCPDIGESPQMLYYYGIRQDPRTGDEKITFDRTRIDTKHRMAFYEVDPAVIEEMVLLTERK